ncbi:glycosyltransferase family 92 protein [Neorhizobium sp. NCHU2750]|uniref:glycosyltransferase family 92 protein n=1 Tax=Neorhizobium sp. NCHU2750 TaxID=1825976 RepID=UPI000E771792|nr:hypothetical protein NCHU2750_01090 [Neorhizobium sp. NCHU2750]
MRFFGFKRPRHVTREIGITPPKPQADRHGIAIVCWIKNEANYIVEWLRFHRAVGVRHFFLYNDGSSDGTFDLVRQTLSEDEVTIIPWSMRMRDEATEEIINAQTVAYAHAIVNFGGQFEWMAFIDADEFLLPKTGLTLEEALTGAGGFPNISLPWHMFGHGGHETRPALPVTQAYTMRARDPMYRHPHALNFKCIVDPTEVTHVSVHHFQTRTFGNKTSNDAGKIFDRRSRKEAGFYSSSFIQLNHYYGRSREEFSRKINRGISYDASTEAYRAKSLSIIDHLETDPVADDAMKDFVERATIKLD